MTTQTPSQHLADFARHLQLEDVPEDVVSMVKRLFIDALGLCYASTDMDFAQPVYEIVKEMGGKQESTIVGKGEKFPAAWAAWVNGIQIHGLDYDDTHSGSVTHTSPSIIPAVLAIGERNYVTGRQLLESAIVGFEVACRIGLSAHGRFQRRGFHTTPIAGAMGAVLSVSKLLGLNVEQMVHAQGIAGSSASGLREAYLSGGSWTKMYHPGWAVHGAIMAALAAEKGFTGTRTVYEGRFGLFKSHLHPDDGDYKALLDDLGHRWEIEKICFKPYPSGVINHAYIDSAINLLNIHKFKVEEVKKVVCYIHPDAAQTVCEPVASKLRPETGYHGKFSLQYNVAAALVDGEVTVQTFSDEKIRDPRILEMTDKVTYQIDKHSSYPNTYPSWLRIELANGQVIEDRQPHNKGSLGNPMTSDDVQKKYINNATMSISEEQALKLQQTIMRLADVDKVDRLSRLL